MATCGLQEKQFVLIVFKLPSVHIATNSCRNNSYLAEYLWTTVTVREEREWMNVNRWWWCAEQVAALGWLTSPAADQHCKCQRVEQFHDNDEMSPPVRVAAYQHKPTVNSTSR